METMIGLSKSLAPEDLGEDDYVAVSRQTIELLPLFCDGDSWLRKPEVVPVRITPGYAGYPMRVVRICLPFVLVRDPNGAAITLDTRRHELVKLSEAYGRKAFKCYTRAAMKQTR